MRARTLTAPNPRRMRGTSATSAANSSGIDTKNQLACASHSYSSASKVKCMAGMLFLTTRPRSDNVAASRLGVEACLREASVIWSRS